MPGLCPVLLRHCRRLERWVHLHPRLEWSRHLLHRRIRLRKRSAPIPQTTPVAWQELQICSSVVPRDPGMPKGTRRAARLIHCDRGCLRVAPGFWPRASCGHYPPWSQVVQCACAHNAERKVQIPSHLTAPRCQVMFASEHRTECRLRPAAALARVVADAAQACPRYLTSHPRMRDSRWSICTGLDI